jgi:hypothetical protein
MNLILIIYHILLFQKAIKQEMDMDHSYLEGEMEADAADEDNSLEHQVGILVNNFLYSTSYLHLQSFTGPQDLLHATLVNSRLAFVVVLPSTYH